MIRHRVMTLILPSNDIRSPKHIFDWIEHVSRPEFEAIGFLTREARARYHHQGKILIYYEQGEPTAFALHSGNQHTGSVQIHQALTTVPARRLLHQSALVDRVITRAMRGGSDHLKIRVADDLDANLFWRARGFQLIDQIKGGSRRARILNLYRLPLEAPLQEGGAPAYTQGAPKTSPFSE